MKKEKESQHAPPKPHRAADVIPLFGRDEMNLIEWPYGPISKTTEKTLFVEHLSFDRDLRREVTRSMLIIGTEAFGLPRPIDDQVLVGLQALTAEQGYQSPTVHFTRYRLCRILGWTPDGKSYKRIQDSFDRLTSAMLKFVDGWWSKGKKTWATEGGFHLVDNYRLCYATDIERHRLREEPSELEDCRFVWGDVIWRSFCDGYIRKLDMEMFRRVTRGRRREVALRLFRILDKRFYRGDCARFELGALAVGNIGLSQDYAPSQLKRILDRASTWLVECDFLRDFSYREKNGACWVEFRKRQSIPKSPSLKRLPVGESRKRAGRPKPERQTSKDKETSLLLARFESLAKKRRDEVLAAALKYASHQAHSLLDGYERTKREGGNAHAEYRRLVLVSYLQSSDAPGDIVPTEVSGLKKHAFAI